MSDEKFIELVCCFRVEGAVRHPDQLHADGLHPVRQLDLHLLLQEVNTRLQTFTSHCDEADSVTDREYESVGLTVQEETDEGEEEDQVHHPGQHGRAGAGGAPTQIQ